MTDLFSFAGWLFVNVGVPVFAPVTLLPLLTFNRFYRDLGHNFLFRAVQEGQLFWTAIGMCAAACYDLGGALNESASPSTRGYAWLWLIWHVFFLVISAVLVLNGTIDSVMRSAENPCDRSTNKNFVRASILITIITSSSFTLVHYWFT